MPPSAPPGRGHAAIHRHASGCMLFVGLGQNGYEMPPADFRFDKTKADYWRGRSEEARVFAESMGQNEPKAIMFRIAEEYEKIARWCEEQHKSTTDTQNKISVMDRTNPAR